MLFDDLSERYGPYTAEMIRQALSLEEFERYEVEELIPYFELKAARLYDEYQLRLNVALPEHAPLSSQEEYLGVLRRRWEQADSLVHFVKAAEESAAARRESEPRKTA